MGLIDKILPSNDAEEFACNDCGHEFDKVVRPEETPTCPDCGSFDLDNG
jgi:peptide subunit release factor 1 (eRF1)